MDQMEWRICQRHPNYEISDSGDVRVRQNDIRRSGSRIKGHINIDGYLTYSLNKKNERAHTLVAEAFIGPKPSENSEVAHNNGSRVNCYFTNLRWSTRKENSDDRVLHSTDPKGVANGRAKITDDDVRYIRRRYREIKFERGNVAELDEMFGLSRGQIIRIARRQAWSHVSDAALS